MNGNRFLVGLLLAAPLAGAAWGEIGVVSPSAPGAQETFGGGGGGPGVPRNSAKGVSATFEGPGAAEPFPEALQGGWRLVGLWNSLGSWWRPEGLQWKGKRERMAFRIKESPFVRGGRWLEASTRLTWALGREAGGPAEVLWYDGAARFRQTFTGHGGERMERSLACRSLGPRALLCEATGGPNVPVYLGFLKE